MKWNINLFLIILFVIYFSLSILSTFAPNDISEVINWIMIVGFLSFFIWMMPKSRKEKNNKHKKG